MMSCKRTLGVALVLGLPLGAEGQVVGRTTAQPSPMIMRAPSPLPTIRMGSVPQSSPGVVGWRDGHSFDRPNWSGVANCWDGRIHCGGFRRHGVFSNIPYWIETAVPYEVPVYVPVPVPTYVTPRYWEAPKAPAKPYDPAKSKMLTIGGGADGGGGVMRIERLEGKMLRLTWRGSTRPVKEARFFLADSVHRPIRSARVDAETPSALFELADIETRVAYTGLTVMFADGSQQTTLVPYPPRPEPPPQ